MLPLARVPVQVAGLPAALDVGGEFFDGEAALDPADVRLGQDKLVERNVARAKA
jgi:hypothetical protein